MEQSEAFSFANRHRLMVTIATVITACWFAGCSMNRVRADFQLGLKNYDGAIELYRQHLTDNPDDVLAKQYLGLAYTKMDRNDEAITIFTDLLADDPDNHYAQYHLGLAHLQNEDFEQAIVAWRKYRNPKLPFAEEEVRRQLTLLEIAVSQRKAQEALAAEASLETASTDDDTYAVCYFRNDTPDQKMSAFQKGLAAMITTSLARIESITVIERLRLQALLAEMKLGQTGIVDIETAPKVGRLLGAENLIIGNLSEGSIRVTTSIAGAQSGAVKGTATVELEKEHFYKLPALIIRDIASISGLQLTAEEIAAIGIPQTTVYDAFIYYGEALDALDTGKWEDAERLFAMAVAADPEFKVAKSDHDACPSADSPAIDSLRDMAPAEIRDKISANMGTVRAVLEAHGIRTIQDAKRMLQQHGIDMNDVY